MKKHITGLSNSLTASIKTEMLCMEVTEDTTNKKEFYFIEYPTNKLPNHNHLHVKGNIVTPLTYWEYTKIKEAFYSFEEKSLEHNYLHAPTFILAYLIPLNVKLDLFS